MVKRKQIERARVIQLLKERKNQPSINRSVLGKELPTSPKTQMTETAAINSPSPDISEIVHNETNTQGSIDGNNNFKPHFT